LLLCCNIMRAQSLENSGMSKLNLYLDVGAGYISSVSINLEARIYSHNSGKVNLYGRVGVGGAGVYWEKSGLGGLGALTMLTGKGKHHFEASGGVFLAYDQSSYDGGLFALAILDLGYRYQKPGGGFVFRGKVCIYGVGIGLGYAF